jgi:uncharacterized membrane protein
MGIGAHRPHHRFVFQLTTIFGKEITLKKKLGVAIVLVVFMCGCVSVIDPADKTEQNQSIGQELIDLKKAFNEGAITENEYQLLKQKIINMDGCK